MKGPTDGAASLSVKTGHWCGRRLRRSRTAVISILLIFVLAAVASVSVTRRTVGRIEAINATSRAIIQSGLGQRIPLRATGDEWDELAANLNSMLDRIETLVGR